MGIKGLLPLLQEIKEDVHLSQLSGKTYAIDGYSWLHKGAWGCAEQLVKGQHTIKYVNFFMERIRLLRYHGIEPYAVFDGGPLPAKKGTENDRQQKREENMAKAKELFAKGKDAQAREYATKCVDITPEYAYQVIKALKAENVDYVVAPYEADAQLAYLERTGVVDGIITEDSDLLVFGCKDILFKLNTNGDCSRIRRERITKCRETNFVGWGDKEFRWMAMLSGCDYLPSIQGMGLKTAHKLLRQWRTVDRVLQHVRREGKMKVPTGYQEEFEMAELAFIYQRVFCPSQKSLVPLNVRTVEVEWSDVKEAFVGENINPEIARGIAAGDLCPITREPIRDINPGYKPRAIKKSQPEVLQDITNNRRASTGSLNTITNFFGRLPRSKSDEGGTKAAKPELASNFKATGSGKRRLADDGEEIRQRKKVRMESVQYAVNGEKVMQADEPTVDTPEATPPDPSLEEAADSVAAGLAAVVRQTNSRFFGGSPAGPTSPETIPSDTCDLGDAPEEMDLAALPSPLPDIPQEDGYMSPLPPSSPVAESVCSMPSPAFARSPSTTPGVKNTAPPLADNKDDVVDVSSPASAQPEARHRPFLKRPGKAPETPTQVKQTAAPRLLVPPTSDIDDWPVTPEDGEAIMASKAGSGKVVEKKSSKSKKMTVESEIEAELEMEDVEDRQKVVSAAWWAKYSLGSTDSADTPPPKERRKPLSGVKPFEPSKTCRTAAKRRAPVSDPASGKSSSSTADKENKADGAGKAVDVEGALKRSRARLLQFCRVG